MNNIRTGEISFRLRTWAERIRSKNRNQYELLCAAADRLDDLDERVAIMTEHEYRGDPVFPPADSELTEKEPINDVMNNWINNWGKHYGIIPDNSELTDSTNGGDSD